MATRSGFAVPPGLYTGPIGFLRTLLTFGCLGLPLIWMKTLHRGHWPVVGDLGLGVLFLIWLLKVLGRFADGGHTSNWYWFPFCVSAWACASLPLRYKIINPYEALAIFLLVQTPLALLKTKPGQERPVRKQRWGEASRERLLRRKPNAEKSLMIRPRTFLCGLLLIALFWILLIYAQAVLGRGSGRWIEWCGYCILGFVWFMVVSGRILDAGWGTEWRSQQFILVVAVASLMPLAVHWVSGYGALAIFVLVQLPIAFQRTRSAG